MTRSNGEPRFKCHGREACKDRKERVDMTEAMYGVSFSLLAGIIIGLLIGRFYI